MPASRLRCIGTGFAFSVFVSVVHTIIEYRNAILPSVLSMDGGVAFGEYNAAMSFLRQR